MRLVSAEFLLIDIGNTQIKLRRANAGRLLGRTRRVATASLLGKSPGDELDSVLQGWPCGGAVLASVVPAATRALMRRLQIPVLPVRAGLDLGVDLRGYAGRHTLGADRLADLAGAWALHGPGALIVADLGTAAVFNAIGADGKFLGGVIAPGLASLHASLPAQTAKLPVVKLRGPPRALGQNTREALRAGAVYGYRGLVREILASLRAELGPARVIVTGGDARQVRQMAEIDVTDPELTLQGLRIIATRHPAAFQTTRL